MLTFLAIASFKKIVVESYNDEAIGHLAKNEQGKFVIAKVELHPQVVFAEGNEPDRATLEAMHHKAHEDCFLANSVTCDIVTKLWIRKSIRFSLVSDRFSEGAIHHLAFLGGFEMCDEVVDDFAQGLS